jgi:hypothetical protein
MNKINLPNLFAHDSVLHEDRLLVWLNENVNSDVTQLHEIYTIPHTEYDGDGILVPETDPAWTAIWNREAIGTYELRTRQVTSDWEYVHRYQIDVEANVYGSTLLEIYFLIPDDTIAVQFKLILHH